MKKHSLSTARAALHLLSQRGLAPTPENYAAVYYEVLGKLPPEVSKLNKEVSLEEKYINHHELVKLVLTLAEAVRDSAGDLLEILGQSNAAIKKSIDSMEHIEENEEILNLVNTVNNAAHAIHASVEETRTELIRDKQALEAMQAELSQAKYQMMLDSLTGARNRFGMDISISQEISRARRAGSLLSLAMVDLDYFKQVNDTLGHDAGDEVLRYFAQFIRSALRETDYLFRYGGEEFLVLLPMADATGAALVLERLRQNLAKSPAHYGQKKIHFTFSSGIAELTKTDNPQLFVQRSDQALYQAKQQGRDRTIIAS